MGLRDMLSLWSGAAPGARPGEPALSPSGRFAIDAVEVDPDGRNAAWHPRILSAGGDVVLDPGLDLSVRHGVLLRWSERDDVAWLCSGDIGITVVRQGGTDSAEGADGADGAWREVEVRSVPLELVPDEVRRSRPDIFDPEGKDR